jgi:predicted RNA binding protein YcfA (HicA-like mRNA interferase family)
LSDRKRKPLHPAKARDVIKALSRIGFSARHAKSSHVFFKHTDGRTTLVPVHPREEIDRTLLRKIAADINLEPEELMYLIDER